MDVRAAAGGMQGAVNYDLSRECAELGTELGEEKSHL